MTDQEEIPEFEMEITLPDHLKGPVTLPNGDSVDIGDSVEHIDLGIGKIYRIATYHDKLGILLCVEFAGGRDEMLGLNFVKKV
jgi:hypothetical protein